MKFGIWANKIRDELDKISFECVWWNSQQIKAIVRNKMFNKNIMI